MRTKPRRATAWTHARSIVILPALATLLLAMSSPSIARAQLTLAYSFETDLEGFGPNGGGITVTQDTIGATVGLQSMKVDIIDGATFVGALTAALTPEIGDPPGMDTVIFDLTITEAFPTEGFVDAGITIFGASQPDSPGGQQFGLQAQFLGNQFPLGDLPVGTHEVLMNLTSATHPLTFAANKSFNDIFGVEGSGPADLIPTGFQIYINKSPNAPWTGYIDNIRLGTAPPAPDADFDNDMDVDGDDLLLWEGAYGPSAVGDADGDLDSDGDDFLIWQRQLTPPPGGGVAVVPEPSSISLVAFSLIALLGRRTSIVRASPAF